MKNIFYLYKFFINFKKPFYLNIYYYTNILLFLLNFWKKIFFFLTIWKYQKTLFKTFLRSTLFLFGPLFPKYQHFLALKAHFSEMRAEIEKVVVAWALLFGFTLFSMSFEIFFAIWTFGFWPLPQKSHSNFFLGHPLGPEHSGL